MHAWDYNYTVYVYDIVMPGVIASLLYYYCHACMHALSCGLNLFGQN
jgi:hypothetical protein